MGRACRSAFLLAFDSARVFRGKKRQRQTYGAEKSVGDASRFDADARTPLEFVVQIKFSFASARIQVCVTKTRSKNSASTHRKRTRCASRSDP